MNFSETKPVKKLFTGITIDGKPLEVYVDEQVNSEIEKEHKQEIHSVSKGVVRVVNQGSKFGNTSGTRSEYSNRTQVLSEEILIHCNYLHERGGTVAVNEFLNKPQDH